MPAPTFLFFFLPIIFGWKLFAWLFIPYFLPTIIALLRRSTSTGGIFALNFFLGWTFIGWIIAFVWSFSSRTQPTTVIVNNTYPSQPYTPPPPYSQPPYTQDPYAHPPYTATDPKQPTQHTSPTLRRNAPGQPADRSNG